MSDFWGSKCTKFDFGWGSAPDPIWGAYSAPLLVELTAFPLTPWLHLRGPTFKGGEGEGR